MKRALLALAAVLAAAATDANAFCVFNDLKDKAVVVTQEEHPDWKRQEARFQKTIACRSTNCLSKRNQRICKKAPSKN